MSYTSDLFATAHRAAGGKGVKFAQFITASLTSSGADVVAAVAGKRIRVLAATVSASPGAANTFEFRSGTTTTIAPFSQNNTVSPVNLGFCPFGLCETAAGEALRIHETGGVASIVRGFITYVEVD